MRGTLKTKDGSPVYSRTDAESVLVTIDGEVFQLSDIIDALNADPVEVLDAGRDADLPAGQSYTVPSYVVGSNHVSVFMDGIRCARGSDSTKHDFYEVGDAGSTSTAIKFHKALGKDIKILVRVG